MAGSIADFKYFDNANRPWLVRIDRSNALATGTGFVAITQADLNLDYLPRNIELRYVHCHHPTKPIIRNIYCQSTNSPIWLGSVPTIQLWDYQFGQIVTFSIGNRTEERAKYRVNLLDTFQNDIST